MQDTRQQNKADLAKVRCPLHASRQMVCRGFFILLLGWLSIWLTSCAKDGQQPFPYRAYSFFTAGHTSGNPSNWHRGFHAPFRDKLHLISNDSLIAFGFLLGDMVKKASIENFQVLDEEIHLIKKPTHFVAGNHDVTDRALFDMRYSPSYYTFQHNNDVFIVLDSNLDGWNIIGAQYAFLEETLLEFPSCHRIFVMVHHLVWWSRDNKFRHIRINSSTGRAPDINFYPEILPLLQAQEKPVYLFAGDVGAQATGSEFMYHKEGLVTYIATGMGGGVRDNFIITDITDAGTVEFRLMAINGDEIQALGKLEEYQLPE